MKTLPLILVAAMMVALAGQSQPVLPLRPPSGLPPGMPSPPAATKDPVNYLIRVEWKEPKGDSKFLELLTAEGNFEFDGLQKNSVKINNNDVPVTLKLSGTITTLSDEKGRLQLFLGRTVPYVTGSFGNGSSSSYSQMSVGLQSTVIVKFGKAAVIQTDENGQISVFVKRLAD